MAEEAKDVIDIGKAPFVHKVGLEVVGHMGEGTFTWDPAKVSLHLAEGQPMGFVNGLVLLDSIHNKRPANVNVMYWLLEHTDLIPESWKGKNIFFLGTVFKDMGGDLHGLCLVRGVNSWYVDTRWMGLNFGENSPVAMLE